MGRGLAIVATVIGAVFTATTLVFLLAGAANTAPEQWHTVEVLLVISGAFGIGSVIGAIWALRAGRAGIAALVGAAPVAFSTGLFFLMVAVEL